MSIKPIAVVLLLAAAAAGAYLWFAGHRGETALTLSGNVDIREVNLSFRVAGRLARLTVDEGDRVRAGTVVGELDAEPFRNALADARANLAALEAHRALYRRGYRQEDIDQARANLAAREAAEHNAEQAISDDATEVVGETSGEKTQC